MTRRTCQLAGLLLGLALLGGLAPAAGAAVPSPCGSMPDAGSFCVVVVNGAKRFSDQPGVLGPSQVDRIGVTTSEGSVDAVWRDALADFRGSSWAQLKNATSVQSTSRIRGTIAASLWRSAISSHSVNVLVDGSTWTKLPDDTTVKDDTTFGLTCGDEGYLVCDPAPGWVYNRSPIFGMEPDLVTLTGFVTIETRLLIVKVINMTDHALIPNASDPITFEGMTRSMSIPTPTQINGLSDTGRPGVGYYHFYRDASRDDTLTLAYRFGNGPAGTPTALTGTYLSAPITVPEDGSTNVNSCPPVTALGVEVECSVTMIGSADGTLEAIVAVQD